MDLTPYLKLVCQKGASDLFVVSNAPIKIKLDGILRSVGKTVLTREMCKDAAYGLMNEQAEKIFEENMECDFAMSLPDGDGSRFRVNVYNQRGDVSMVLRRIPASVPHLDELNLPGVLGDLAMHKNGMVLMVGATGSGKSTTLAAMLRHRNQNSRGHILTVEDPIEYSHQNEKSIVSQREVGVDTQSYAKAFKSCMREAPDVILIGEIRDRETMEAVMEFSNTGHLVFSTLHANNANQTMDRIMNMFPQDMHRQLYMDLSLNIRAIISQRLIRRMDGTLCAAAEIMINTPHIADLILNGKISELKEAMQESGQRGMQTFDQALHELYKDGVIDMETALSNADSRANLENLIHFS